MSTPATPDPIIAKMQEIQSAFPTDSGTAWEVYVKLKALEKAPAADPGLVPFRRS